VIPITDAHQEYVAGLAKRLHDLNIRASADLASERMNAKIRNAQLMKVPTSWWWATKRWRTTRWRCASETVSRQDDLPIEQFITLVQETYQHPFGRNCNPRSGPIPDG
jgi:threonyl-tRNA synthetase